MMINTESKTTAQEAEKPPEPSTVVLLHLEKCSRALVEITELVSALQKPLLPELLADLARVRALQARLTATSAQRAANSPVQDLVEKYSVHLPDPPAVVAQQSDIAVVAQAITQEVLARAQALELSRTTLLTWLHTLFGEDWESGNPQALTDLQTAYAEVKKNEDELINSVKERISWEFLPWILPPGEGLRGSIMRSKARIKAFFMPLPRAEVATSIITILQKYEQGSEIGRIHTECIAMQHAFLNQDKTLDNMPSPWSEEEIIKWLASPEKAQEQLSLLLVRENSRKLREIGEFLRYFREQVVHCTNALYPERLAYVKAGLVRVNNAEAQTMQADDGAPVASSDQAGSTTRDFVDDVDERERINQLLLALRKTYTMLGAVFP